ncbi:protein NYNRIN-like [Grus japonensis]|uniref:Protein NYNRIN-like n=1 Tax=Grus japonensis TaxID=30415 RepID=A0ABC9YIZ2_GRUJA
MFACRGSNGAADSGSSKIDYGPKDSGICTTHGNNCLLERKGGHWLSPSRMWKYQVVLLEQDDVELKTTAIVNPAMFLSTENPTEKLEHDCLLTIEQVYSSRPDLKDEPLKDPDLELFTDGSSFVQEGRRMARDAVVTTDKVLESGTLPANTSAQKAESVALKQALRMAEGKRVNIQTDSKYAFGVIHAHGAIWKERGLLSAQGSPIRHKEEVLQLLQDVQKPKEVAVMHCKAHQFGQTAVNVGNRLADKAAKEAAGQGILALVPVKQMKIPNLKARYSKLDEQLAEHLKASQNTEGWWVTPENQVIVTPQVMLELAKEKHEQTHWGVDAMVTSLRTSVMCLG